MSMQGQVHLNEGGLEMLHLNVVVAMLSEQAHEEGFDRLAAVKRTLSPDLQPAKISLPSVFDSLL